MNIDSIKNGIVIDHITAGKGMTIYKLLGLDKLDCLLEIFSIHKVPNALKYVATQYYPMVEFENQC